MPQHILLTGANGYVGSHILALLLDRNLSVRAVVRSQSKADQVLSDFPNHKSQLSFAVVPDITAPGAYDTAVVSDPPFDTVIHTASPFLYRAVSSNLEFLEPAVKGTTELLKAVHKIAPAVKRVIITSSCAAVVNWGAEAARAPNDAPKTYKEEDWNPVTWDQALAGPPNTAYQASKKYAETAAWDFVKQEKPKFDVVTICPPMIYGPLRHSVKSVKDLNESTARIYNLFFNAGKDAPLPPNGMPIFSDVRDVAEAHVRAAEVEAAGGERFIVTAAGHTTSQDISDILRAKIPELEERVPIGVKGGNKLPSSAYIINGEKVQKFLELRLHTVEETFVDMGKQLLEIEKQGS